MNLIYRTVKSNNRILHFKKKKLKKCNVNYYPNDDDDPCSDLFFIFLYFLNICYYLFDDFFYYSNLEITNITRETQIKAIRCTTWWKSPIPYIRTEVHMILSPQILIRVWVLKLPTTLKVDIPKKIPEILLLKNILIPCALVALHLGT